MTVIVPFAPGGAKRLRALLQLLNGNFSGGKKVGTLHDMRFVFLDNDTKLLFATAYDGEWDAYIDDFATKIPDDMDIIFSAFEGWPGIRSPEVKDWIVKHQITAEGWYVAHPDLTVAETGRLKRVGKAVDEFLDKVGELDPQHTSRARPKGESSHGNANSNSEPSQNRATVEQKLQKLRELYADAPEMGKAALKNGLSMLTEELAAPRRAQTAGRIGARQGKVSELTVFLPFVKGGAKRLRGLLQLLEGNFRAADAVGTVHDMRFVFVDNDTKLLFATAYDGDFDPYIDDFAAKIPNAMDLWLCNFEGYPGMRNP